MKSAVRLAGAMVKRECPTITGEDTGTILGISVTFLTFLAGALTYICLYVRSL